MKIIDSHVHVVQYIAGIGAEGELRACGNGKAIYSTGKVIDMIPSNLGEYNVTPEKVIKVLDKYNVEKAVLLQGNYFGYQNLYTYDAVKKYPSRFIGVASYDPYSYKVDEIKKHLFDELKFRIVKFEVSTGSGVMCNHKIFKLDGEIMEKEYTYAEEKDLVFVIDIGKIGSESSQIENLAKAVIKHPKLKFVVCHLLAPNQKSKQIFIQGLHKLHLPNVWFDLAALPNNCAPEVYPYPFARECLIEAISIVGVDKIIWGTDLPSATVKYSYEQCISYIMDFDKISIEDKKKIFYKNAKNVYENI